MNAFYEHHKSSIEFAYRCFDRILLNGLVQPFQQPERVIGFFNTYGDGKRVIRQTLTEIADQFHHWVINRAERWGAPIVEAPQQERRDDFVLPYLQKSEADHVAVILKAREPARILVAIGGKQNQCPHLELKQRGVNQYNFYLNDQPWGPMFVRMCPYFPFSARVCLNQHHWLALRMQQQGIPFRQCKNAFLRCSDPERLQQLAHSLTAQDLLRCGQKWLAAFTPFFSSQERPQAGCQHRLFFSPVELCDNLIFFRRAAVDQFAERLLDMNRTIAQPKKITLIFGRKVTRQYKGKLQTELQDLDLPNPVIRSHYAHGFAKQYVRHDRLLRTEPATNDVTDYGVKKNLENLPQLRQRMSDIIDHYHDAQQDILETFIDRGQLQKLAEPTTLTNGKRIPGLKLDHPRQLAVMHVWSAMPTSPPAPLSPPPISTRRCWTLSDSPSPNTPWHRCATTSPNCAPKVCSKNCPTRGATVSPTRAIPSACSSSSYSSASMLHSSRVSSSLSPAIATSPRTNAVHWTASINGSPTILTLSFPQSASRPLLNQYNENKILVSRCIID
jgi:hypothetical protein